MLSYFHTKEDFNFGSLLLSSGEYVTTRSNFADVCKALAAAGIDPNETVQPLLPEDIEQHEDFPVCASFRESLEDAFSSLMDKEHIRIAITNAFGGTAFGDNLIGFNAFGLWKRKLQEKFPDKTFEINLFQVSPRAVAPVAVGWKEQIDHIDSLPIPLPIFMGHDAYFDFSSMILNPKFDELNLFDFFLHGLSIGNEDIPDESKRLKYTTHPAADQLVEILSRWIRKRAGGRQIVLLNPLASSPLRTMPASYVVELIPKLTRGGYFVLTSCGVDSQNNNHMDVKNFCPVFEDFASVVQQVDCLVTVDTVTAHLSDAYDIPAVVLFTSIEPDLRIRYYPRAAGIMLEEKDGPIYGLHKINPETNEGKRAYQHVLDLWKNQPADEIVTTLRQLA